MQTQYLKKRKYDQEGESMDTYKYKILLEAIECGSFSRVAIEQGYTQSGISHMVKCIEKEIGFPIFVRNKMGITLTRLAQEILPDIRALVYANNNLQQHIDNITGLTSGVIRIGAFTSIIKMILLPIMKTFSQDYPNIRFELIDGTSCEHTQWLYMNRIDIGFFSRQSNQAQLKYYPIKEDPMIVLMPHDHPLAKYSSFDVAHFSEETFIVPSADGGEEGAMRIIKEFNIKVDSTYSTRDSYATISMVENGMGLALMSELVYKSHTANVVALPLSVPQYRTLGMFVLSNLELPPAAKRFFQYCRKMIPSLLAQLASCPETTV